MLIAIASHGTDAVKFFNPWNQFPPFSYDKSFEILGGGTMAEIDSEKLRKSLEKMAKTMNEDVRKAFEKEFVDTWRTIEDFLENMCRSSQLIPCIILFNPV